MRWQAWARCFGTVAVVVLAGTNCGDGGRDGSSSPSTASPTQAPTAATAAPTSALAVPAFDDLLAKIRTALLQPGMVTHVSMDVRTQAAPGAESQDATVDAWVDPTVPLVRVEHLRAPATGSDVTILDSTSGIIPEDPAVVELLRLLATQPAGTPPITPPGGVTIRADVLDGRSVLVSEFLFPPVGESPAQRVSLTYDADGRPVDETRRPEGDDTGWTTTIAYEVDFVDPATLPADFWQGHEVGAPPPETAPATEPSAGPATS